MKIVIQDSDFEFVFEASIPRFKGTDEELDQRRELLYKELAARNLSSERDYYVDKVTRLTDDAELWGLGT